MGDNIQLWDRNGVRTPMQWNNTLNAGFSEAPSARLYAPVITHADYCPEQVNVAGQLADPDSILNTIRWMVATRKSNQVFGRGSFAWASVDTPAVAAYWREYEGERMLILNNLSGQALSGMVTLPEPIPAAFRSLLSGELSAAGGEGLRVELEPYQFLWLAAE